MKNILIVLGIILGIAVFVAESGLFKKNKPIETNVKKKNKKLWIIKTSEKFILQGMFLGNRTFFSADSRCSGN